MTKTRRIVLNTAVTYGRSIISLFVGVFSARWLLMGLGQSDLGLSAVVSSLISAIIIFETVMQVAVARYYAYAIGQAEKMDAEAGRMEVCRWFNVVFLIHLFLPILIVLIGFPVGEYAVRNWLVIPEERLQACLFVFRCSLGSAFISMLAVPYLAMYRAYQHIAELTVFDILRTLINFGLTFSLLYITCDKLKYYGLVVMLVNFCILGTQMYRAVRIYDVCRIVPAYLFDWARIRQIFYFFFWEIFSCVGNMTRAQGAVFVINKFFGEKVNAAFSIAGTLSNQATALSGALMGALLPAVTTEEGAGEREKMIKLSFRTCKFGALLILLFSIPLILEMDEVLRLWLINPPQHTGELCSLILIAYIVEKFGLGHHIAISAKGKIGFYHAIVGSTFFLSLPIAIALVLLGLGPCSVGTMFVICFGLISVERVIFARYLVQMPVGVYVLRVLVPLCLMSCLTGAFGWLVTIALPPSFLRVALTSVVCVCCMTALSYAFVLDAEERLFVNKAFLRIRRFGSNG